METVEALRIFANMISFMLEDINRNIEIEGSGSNQEQLKTIASDARKLRESFHIAMMTWEDSREYKFPTSGEERAND
jgi:hypothetical protein